MIEHVFRVGYVTRQKERDYDPMGNEVVCDAIEKWDAMITQLMNSSDRLEAIYKNTGSLGAKEQMETNKLLIAKIVNEQSL